METIVSLKNVKKNYSNGEVIVHALQGIDMTIKKGEFIAMAGPSGSGKTTLLNLIGALDKPSSGQVEVNGQNIEDLSTSQQSKLRRDHIGFVFQSYNLIPVLSAFENTEYILMLQGVGIKERREKAMEILKQVGLLGMEDRRPNQLSGGQQQRVAIARAIASQPALVLADEPTANLDSKTAEDLLDLMQKLHKEKNITFLFSTHDMTVMKRSEKLMWLHDGKITYKGSPNAFEMP
jgi:putative ABC transport system ATP-binding protein